MDDFILTFIWILSNWFLKFAFFINNLRWLYSLNDSFWYFIMLIHRLAETKSLVILYAFFKNNSLLKLFLFLQPDLILSFLNYNLCDIMFRIALSSIFSNHFYLIYQFVWSGFSNLKHLFKLWITLSISCKSQSCFPFPLGLDFQLIKYVSLLPVPDDVWVSANSLFFSRQSWLISILL